MCPRLGRCGRSRKTSIPEYFRPARWYARQDFPSSGAPKQNMKQRYRPNSVRPLSAPRPRSLGAAAQAKSPLASSTEPTMTPTRSGAEAPSAEEQRLQDCPAAWKRWGPYHHAAGVERGRAQRHAPGAGRHAMDQAVLLLRPRPLAGGARESPVQSYRAWHQRAQSRVGAHAKRRHHLHARQVGCTSSSRPGPGVPLLSR